MEYLNQSIKKYLDDLAAKLPAPGGGSASALIGAEALALLAMVLNFTIGKKGYENFWNEAETLLKEVEEIRDRFSILIDKDVRAYRELNRVFKMPKESDEAKEKRRQALELALKKAEAVPEEICRLSYEGIKLAPKVLEKGNKSLASDVGVAAAAFAASFKGGRFNVEINLKSIKDIEFCKDVRARLDTWQEELLKIESKVTHTLK